MFIGKNDKEFEKEILKSEKIIKKNIKEEYIEYFIENYNYNEWAMKEEWEYSITYGFEDRMFRIFFEYYQKIYSPELLEKLNLKELRFSTFDHIFSAYSLEKEQLHNYSNNLYIKYNENIFTINFELRDIILTMYILKNKIEQLCFYEDLDEEDFTVQFKIRDVSYKLKYNDKMIAEIFNKHERIIGNKDNRSIEIHCPKVNLKKLFHIILYYDYIDIPEKYILNKICREGGFVENEDI